MTLKINWFVGPQSCGCIGRYYIKATKVAFWTVTGSFPGTNPLYIPNITKLQSNYIYVIKLYIILSYTEHECL